VTTPGSPRADDGHYPPAPPGALDRTPRPRTAAEARFLGIGDGAGLWLAGAVQLAALHGQEVADRALGQAAAAGRFADGDLSAILTHQAAGGGGEPSRAGEQASLAQGTAGWARHGGTEAAR
jgi:hypothetical protein